MQNTSQATLSHRLQYSWKKTQHKILCKFSITGVGLHTATYIQATKSQGLWIPCFAKASATKLDSSLSVWWKCSFSFFKALRMKLRANFKFHWPPLSALHHKTALWESDSIITWSCRSDSFSMVMLIALWIALISALLISIWGMGQENEHLNSPKQFLRTPPTADRERWEVIKASTFHLTKSGEGATHRGSLCRNI